MSISIPEIILILKPDGSCLETAALIFPVRESQRGTMVDNLGVRMQRLICKAEFERINVLHWPVCVYVLPGNVSVLLRPGCVPAGRH